MKTYIGTKIIQAEPRTRGAYNELRGWTPPEGEDQSVDGYVVQHPDGYVSWSPKAQFESAYLYIHMGDLTAMPDHQQRVVGEMVQLHDKCVKLNAFMQGEKFHVLCDEPERIRMINQYNAMAMYREILIQRIAAFSGRKMIGLPVIDAMTEDFPLGKPCDLSGEKGCEACQ